VHILPGLGRRPLASLRRAHLEEWATTLPLAPSSVKTVFATLSSVLAAAVEDGRLPRNPAVKAKLPKVERAPVVPLDVVEVRRLVAATPEHLRAAVVLGAGTGLRQGEAMAVTVDRLQSLRREVRIDRQLWTPRHGEPVFAPPKSQRGYRTIALGGLVGRCAGRPPGRVRAGSGRTAVPLPGATDQPGLPDEVDSGGGETGRTTGGHVA
jgi:integrase